MLINVLQLSLLPVKIRTECEVSQSQNNHSQLAQTKAARPSHSL